MKSSEAKMHSAGHPIYSEIYKEGVVQWLLLVLHERFGHSFTLTLDPRGRLYLSLQNASGTIVFDALEPYFFTPGSGLPYSEWDALSEGWTPILGMSLPAPGVAGLSSPLIEQVPEGFTVHYDILGLTYWMLSRQEEVGRNDLDQHCRFPATSSHAYEHGYLGRPVVDEWLDILRQVINRQWPGLELKQHNPRTLVSCDVDSPYLPYSQSFMSTARVVLGDLLKRKSLKAGRQNLQRYIGVRRADYSLDPYVAAIDWIMDVNERVGNRVAFYFIPEHLDHAYDSNYCLDEPVLRNLLKSIYSRGHEIGLHSSYTSYKNTGQIDRELEIMRNALVSEGICQQVAGGRQHYLRWEVPTTACNLDAAGLIYDTTLGYADRPGFRCGTCFEYPMFDPVRGRALSLRQRPLVLMESSVIDMAYMGLGYTEDALKYMHLIKERCCQVGGDFTLLWHNSNFRCDKDKEFYLEMIS